MARETKQDGKSGKRRRWKTRRPNPPPELILPPQLRSALGLSPAFDRRYFDAVDRELMKLHKRYDDGDRSALLDAIYMLGVFFPAWVREGFVEALAQYQQYNVKTLDEAFGVKRLKGQHLKAARKRELLRPQIIFEVYCRHAKGAPLDQGTFEAVGRDLGISGGEATKIFSEPKSDNLRDIVRTLQISD
jgi:hypothetical protein